MSIFRREPSGPPPPEPAPQRRAAERRAPAPASGERAVTLIAAGTRVTGEITGATDLAIEGEVQGTIRLDAAVLVGARGRAEGEVSARVVRIAGRVQGNVRGVERVELLPSGSLDGDISSARVIIAEGAFFKGQVEMSGKGGDAGDRREPPPPGAGAPKPGPAAGEPTPAERGRPEPGREERSPGDAEPSPRPPLFP